ncbi:hypothetical protein CHS0354_037506 [Potamilus streckersoni]|uniref:Uncharacterized protein n=1 Tax=Potamilus streckersoni TaxID=2493646 RepID=A0AAE0VG72_9BIVA|nr:hypothetical protein CHS0354_037506 [Potamilus streckersoni]
MTDANPTNIQYEGKPHCSICLCNFKIPRQLTCLHSFCQSCLEDYILSRAKKVNELKQFECPICRSVVVIPRKGKTSKICAALFPINSILQSIGGDESEEVNRPCDCCLSESVSAAASGFCMVCEEAMCTSCIKFHQKQKVSKEHSFVSIEELTNNPKNSIRFDKGFRCQEHEEEDLKFYCKDHKIACCASCCIVHHRNCDQVLDLRRDANNLLNDVKPLHILDEMKIIENLLMNFEKKNDANIANLESQVQEMTNKIKEIRKKLNDLLDALERNVKSEGRQLCKQEAIRKQEENHECQALFNAIRNSHVTLETVMKHGSDLQIFIVASRMDTQMKSYNEQVKEKFDETETVILDLEFDPQIQCFLAQSSDIGRLVCRKEREGFPMSRMDNPLKECQVEMMEGVMIFGPDGKGDGHTGVTYLRGDQVMLTDFMNKKVLLLNSSYQYIASATLPGSPRDICVVDDKEVVVSLTGMKTLQFLCVTNGFIKLTRTVHTRYACQGIAPGRRGDIVVSGNCNDNGKYYWSLINSKGVEETCYQFDCQCNLSMTYVAVNSSCTRVYITVMNANSLYCFNMDGRMMFQYSPDSLRYPVGVATDKNDYVYLVGHESQNIHQLTSDGTPLGIITNDIPYDVYAICFNNNGDKFLVTSISIKLEQKNLYLFRVK